MHKNLDRQSSLKNICSTRDLDDFITRKDTCKNEKEKEGGQNDADVDDDVDDDDIDDDDDDDADDDSAFADIVRSSKADADAFEGD